MIKKKKRGFAENFLSLRERMEIILAGTIFYIIFFLNRMFGSANQVFQTIFFSRAK